MPDQNQVLLQTKLHKPQLPHELVVRSRLLEWLNRGIDYPLTLVCAPAGYGKTTLICTWLHRMSVGRSEGMAFLPSAWLSLDEDDSDLNLFLRYFIAALRTIFTDACANTFALLQAGQPPPQAFLRTMLFNELEELSGEAILVLDDYQFIHGNAGAQSADRVDAPLAKTAASCADLTHRPASSADQPASEGEYP